MNTKQTKPNELVRKKAGYKVSVSSRRQIEEKERFLDLFVRRRHMSGLMCPPPGSMPSEFQRSEKLH